MARPEELEAVAAGMYANRRGERLSPYLLSLIVTLCFQTIATLQFTEWCARSWSTERRTIRFLAIWMICSGLGHAFTQCARAMDVFVFHFGEYHALLYQLKPRILVGFMTAAHLGSQAFYMQRACVLSGGSKVLLLFFGAAWISLVCLSIAAIALCPKLLTEFGHADLRPFTAQGALIAFTDVSITSLTIWFLYKRRGEEGQTHANSLIKRLILLSVETQLPVSIFAVMMSITNAVGSVFFSPVGIALICTLSQVTLFKVLNSRRRIREQAGLTVEAEVSFSSTESKVATNDVPRLDYASHASTGTSSNIETDKEDGQLSMAGNFHYGFRREGV